MARAETQNAEQLMSDFVAFIDGDASKQGVIAESFRCHGPGLPDEGIQGVQAYKEYLKPLRSAFPDLKHKIDKMLASNELVMTEWTVTGTHKGEFGGIPPTGRTIKVRTMAAYVVADGKLQEERGYFNVQDLLNQLGVVGQ